MGENSKNQFDFPPVKKEDWLKAITRELKGADVSTVRKEIEEGITVEPFYMEEEVSFAEAIELSPASEDIVIAEFFDLDDTGILEQLQQSLEGGCNSPEFIFSDVNQLKTVFQFLKPDYVFSVYHTDTHNAIEVSGLIAEESREAAGALLVPFNFNAAFWSTRVHCLSKLPHFRYGYIHYRYEEVRTEQIYQLILIFESYLHDGRIKGIQPEELVETIVIGWETGNDFLIDTAALRALQIVLANLLEDFGYKGNSLPYIQVQIAESSLTEDKNINMIRLTTQAVATYYARADRLLLPPANVQKNEIRNSDRRISRNIHHLLVMESWMNKQTDGLAGSYFFETLSAEMANKVWQKLESN